MRECSPSGNVWTCLCECGAEAVRKERSLRYGYYEAMCFACRAGKREAPWKRKKVKPAEKPVSGPMLETGVGEKRDCKLYGGCLSTFIKRKPHATNARCPADCAHFVPVARLFEERRVSVDTTD